MSQESVVQIRDLSKRFGSTLALDRVSFDVPAHTLFGLLGPNGAGKTTLFSLAAGFLKPNRGSIVVLGVDVERISELRGRLALLPQDALFQANVPILEQLIFFCQLSGYNRPGAEEEAFRALEIVGLAEAAHKNARALSHGMAKRLGIAQAFLGHPEVILLDEPTAGLDPANAKAIRDLIRQLQSTATLVISSHNLREIQEMCSHVAIIDRGRLVECGEVADLTFAGKQVRFRFSRPLNPPETRQILEVPGAARLTMNREEEYTLHLELDDGARTQEEVIVAVLKRVLEAGVYPRQVSEGASLEARFLEVTGQGERGEVQCPVCGAYLEGDNLPPVCPECKQALAPGGPERAGPPDVRIK